jgi:C1A family cysteine protease
MSKQSIKTRLNKWYGWRPDLPDQRDHVFGAPAITVLPPSIDLRLHCPPVVDQGNLGSCTANAIVGAIGFDQIKQGQPVWAPSRLQVYYNERVIEGSVGEDAGAEIRDGIKVIAKLGAGHEKLWPYVISKFKTKPPAKVVADGKKHLALKYARVMRSAHGILSTLAGGFPFVFGFSVYDSFESDEVAKTGVVPMPGPGEQLLGGHAVLAVGFTDHTTIVVRNSWGTDWGQQGYFTMPIAYFLDPNLSDDFWVVRQVE